MPASAEVHLQRRDAGGDANESDAPLSDRSSSPTLSAILMVVFGALRSRSWWLASGSFSRRPRSLGVGDFGDGGFGDGEIVVLKRTRRRDTRRWQRSLLAP